MLKKIMLGIFLGLVLLVGSVLGFATTRPDTFKVERSQTIKASPEEVFQHINNFQNWKNWSPWEKLDPKMKKKFEGPKEGVGAIYSWAGEGNVGEGQMEITEAEPGEKVVIKLDFLKPFEAHNITEFTLEATEAGSTKVVWQMTGPNAFMGKLISVFISMDAMVGKDFESGLKSLKTLAEKES